MNLRWLIFIKKFIVQETLGSQVSNKIKCVYVKIIVILIDQVYNGKRKECMHRRKVFTLKSSTQCEISKLCDEEKLAGVCNDSRGSLWVQWIA